MPPLLTIGELAARCGLSRSALRFYDRSGLLRPCAVDEANGYRRYADAQVDEARLIRRLRAAELPVDLVREFLAAGPARRAAILDAHAAAFRDRAQAVATAVDDLRGTVVDERVARWCTIAPEVLAGALHQIAFAVAAPESRPELSCVWIETREGSLRLVATDSYRLAVRDLVPDALGPVAIRGAIDAELLPQLGADLRDATSLRIQQDDGGDIEAALDGRRLAVGGRGDGFPDYERVLSGIPVGGEVILAREALTRAIASVDHSNAPLALRFRAGGVVVAAGDERAAVPGAWSGADLDVRLDRAFLSQALVATVGPDICIEAADPRQPVTLRSADTGSFCVLTMPLGPDGER